jgi:hypothetical protein
MQYTVMLTSLTVAVSKSALGALQRGDRLCVTLPKKGRCGSTTLTWWWLDSTPVQSHFSAAHWEQSQSRAIHARQVSVNLPNRCIQSHNWKMHACRTNACLVRLCMPTGHKQWMASRYASMSFFPSNPPFLARIITRCTNMHVFDWLIDIILYYWS